MRVILVLAILGALAGCGDVPGQGEPATAPVEHWIIPGTHPAANLPVSIPLICHTAGQREFSALAARGDGSEVLYPFLVEGDVESADLILTGVWPVGGKRFEPAPLTWPPTWREDPYGEHYWSFLFYSLRPTRHLLAAYQQTGNTAYLDALVTVTDSFLDSAMTSPVIDDKHGAAFLALQLALIYTRLDQWCALTDERAARLVTAIRDRGYFLAVDAHFERHNNHGLTQSAALLLIATELPFIPEAERWQRLGEERLVTVISKNVAADGVQIEQSPFYHFYVLRFLWHIFAWTEAHTDWRSPILASSIDGMLEFAAWVVQPDGRLPLIASTVEDTIVGESDDALARMAERHPTFAWVWSSGRDGSPPPDQARLFAESGWSIMRSSWERDDLADATQVIFDVGPWRTSHSHHDALSVHLFGAGRPLLIDPGLYTYEPGSAHDYFWSTAAHNTVVVDHTDQARGTATADLFEVGDGWAFQSGTHGLYTDVEHRRGVALVGSDLMVVFDELQGSGHHTYQQTWHLAADLDVALDDTTANASFDGSDVISISQLRPDESTVRVRSDGWVSTTYENRLPAPVVSASTAGESATFVTVVAIGQPWDLTYRPNHNGHSVAAARDGREVLVTVTNLGGGRDESIEVTID